MYFDNYIFATIMQGRTNYMQPLQGCVHLVNNTTMIMQACNKYVRMGRITLRLIPIGINLLV